MRLIFVALFVATLAASSQAAETPANDSTKWQQIFDSWKKPHDPFRIAENLYYVGAIGVSSFLVTTKQGHILLDTGFEETVGVIRTNVARLGFRIEDIKFLLASHAHFDHVGGHALMKDLTGAQIVMSEPDGAILANGGKDNHGPTPPDQLLPFRAVRPDRIVHDGDTVTLGDAKLTCHLTPGHTRGATTWTMSVKEGDRQLQVLFFSSLSLLDGTRLLDNPGYPQLVTDYQASFAKLRALPCDIFLAPHGSMFEISQKAERLVRGEKPNPFIDRPSLLAAVANVEKAVNARLAKEKSAAAKREAN